MITKVLAGAAIAFAAAAGVAAPASADPSPFGTLGCSCTPAAAVPNDKAPVTDQMNQGIQNGLGFLGGSAPGPNHS